MSRGFHPLCERRVILLIPAILSWSLCIVQPDSSPVPGAWVGFDGSWTGAADASGVFRWEGVLPDTLNIHSTGFQDWKGVPPADGDSIVLHPAVMESGEMITVLASRGELRPRVPSADIVGEKGLSAISLLGMERLGGTVPGVTVREYGGAVPVVSVSLRGSDPGRADYMVDGVSVVSPRDGMPTGVFDPAIFSSLEIARGGGIPGGSGSGALNWLPPSGSSPASITLSCFSQGAFGASTRFSRTGMSVKRTVGVEGSTGFSASGVSTFAAGRFSGGILCGWAGGGTESPLWTVPGDGERRQGQIEGWLNASEGCFELDVSGGGGYMDYAQTVPFSVDDSHTDQTARITGLWKGPINIAASLRGSRASSTATGDNSLGAGSFSCSYPGDHFSLHAGIDHDGETALFQGRASVRGNPLNTRFACHMSAFTSSRRPTLNDLYWPFDGTTEGNPDLKSERTMGAEAGAGWNGPVFTGEVCLFIQSTGDLILWLPGEDGIWTPSNVSSTLSRGIESSGSFSPGPFSLSASFTWNIAEDRTDGTLRYGMLLPYRPEYSWGARIEAPLPFNAQLHAALSGQGKRFTNRTQTEYLDDYWIMDITLSRRVSETLTASFCVSNLLDEVYSTGDGYPGRGRSMGLILQYDGE